MSFNFYTFNFFNTPINNDYPENNSQFDIKFANTISVGYFSNNLYREDIRSKHSTILDKPAFNFDEKFQIILSIGDTNDIETSDFCCMSIPNSVLYFGLNLLYSHYENFAIRTGMGFEVGFGNYKNPYISTGLSVVYLHDMVFNSKENTNSKNDNDSDGDISFFFNIGYKYDMHFFLDVSGAFFEIFDDYSGFYIYPYYMSVDITLGYKKLIPLFFKIKAIEFCSYDKKINYTDGMQYSHEHGLGLIHLQYYGDSFGLSIGYSDYHERYIKKILNDKQDGYLDDIVLDERKYHGGGITFDLKNAAKTFEFFGELHVLADKDYNWLTICKFGTTVYF